MKERIVYFDIIKLFGIFLVVWAHVLQNLTVIPDYWLTDPLCQVIISFHMPLFMMISGYFAYSSFLKPSTINVIRNKFVQLVVPSVIWGLIVTGMAMVLHWNFSVEKFYFLAVNTLFSYWFLKSLFFCYLLTLIGVYIFRISKTIMVAYVILVCSISRYLDYSSAMSMMPFFLFGVFLHQNESLLRTFWKPILSISLVVYLSMMACFSLSEYNVYSYPFAENSLKPFLIRVLIGTSGSVSCIILIKDVVSSFKTSFWPKISTIGQMTMGIYLIQLIFAESICKLVSPMASYLYHKLPPPIWIWYDFLITPLVTIIIIKISVAIITILRRNPLVRLLLLGEK